MADKDLYSLHSMENIKRAKEDNQYLGDLIMANGALIRFTINKYVGNPKVLLEEYSIEMDDVMQVGRMAFIKAVDGFDCSRGILFTSYVPIAITRDVRHYLRDKGRDIKMPRPAHSLFLSINQYLSNIQYNEINFDEVAEGLGKPVDEVYKAWCIGSKVYELDRKVPTNNTGCGDTAFTWTESLEDSDPAIADEVIDKLYLESLLGAVKENLSEFECMVVDQKIKGDMQSEIAKEYDVSQMQISRIMKKVRTLLTKELERNNQ